MTRKEFKRHVRKTVKRTMVSHGQRPDTMAITPQIAARYRLRNGETFGGVRILIHQDAGSL